MLPNCCCEPDCTPQNEVCVGWGLDWLAEPNSFFAQCPIGPTTVDFSLIDIAGFDEDKTLQLSWKCDNFGTASCNGPITPELHPNIKETEAIVPFTKLQSFGYAKDLYFNAYYAGCDNVYIMESPNALFPSYISSISQGTWLTYPLNCRLHPNQSELIYDLHKAKFYGTNEPTAIDVDDFRMQYKCGSDCKTTGTFPPIQTVWDETDSRTLNYHANYGITAITSTEITGCSNRIRPWYTDWTNYSAGYCDCASYFAATGNTGSYQNIGMWVNSKLNPGSPFYPYTVGNPCVSCNTNDNCAEDGWATTFWGGGPCTQTANSNCTSITGIGSQSWVDIVAQGGVNHGSGSFYLTNLASDIFTYGDIVIGHSFFYESTATKCHIRYGFSFVDQTLDTSSLISQRAAGISIGVPVSYESVPSDWLLGIGGGGGVLNLLPTYARQIFLVVVSGWGIGSTPEYTDIFVGRGPKREHPLFAYPVHTISLENITNITSLSIEIERYINFTLNNKIKKATFFLNDEQIYEFIYPSDEGLRICNSAPLESVCSIITGDYHGFNNSIEYDPENFFFCSYGSVCGYPTYGINCEKYLDPAMATAPNSFTISAPTITWS